MVNRLTRIFYKNTFFYYPLRPVNALANLGLLEAATCVLSYAKERLRPQAAESRTFEQWIVSRFGRRLFEIFFKTYSEKLWGIPCDELDADFAAQRIRKLSLLESLKSALLGGDKTTHRTFVDQFAYPHAGTGMLYERMASFVRDSGGEIHLRTAVKSVVTRDNVVVGLELENGELRTFDHVISSMPLSLLVLRLPGAPEAVRVLARSLKFRNTILIYLKVESTELFQDNWLYIHSPEFKVGRITNFRNWIPQLYGNSQSSILALEYWCSDYDLIWTRADENLIELAKQELRSTGLIGDAEMSAGFVYRIKRCYPVYEAGYKEKLKPIQEYLSTVFGLTVIGRYGAFKYNNQDHSILMGLLAAENIVNGASHDLWAINTDFDEYQEAAVITKTGLVREDPVTKAPKLVAIIPRTVPQPFGAPRFTNLLGPLRKPGFRQSTRARDSQTTGYEATGGDGRATPE
jgi:protoporphyrinogen oxidase